MRAKRLLKKIAPVRGYRSGCTDWDDFMSLAHAFGLAVRGRERIAKE
ncbi:MAG TPA: hypothetical protein VOA41_06940 [Candidatus Dormibacteraeota bacterium]|nr:hypothetical protein [Candidatus Dormibacteraeota bacterium]